MILLALNADVFNTVLLMIIFDQLIPDTAHINVLQ
jgi:hypothetical protein